GAILASGVAADMATASHPAWWALVGLEALVLVLAVVATSQRAMRSAARVLVATGPSAARA
ncbi:MAG TPA: hypothetical protein PKB03_07055, partial [Baekduia sp.]|nr:hypothetical protein [Baekduia sp.]